MDNQVYKFCTPEKPPSINTPLVQLSKIVMHSMFNAINYLSRIHAERTRSNSFSKLVEFLWSKFPRKDNMRQIKRSWKPFFILNTYLHRDCKRLSLIPSSPQFKRKIVGWRCSTLKKLRKWPMLAPARFDVHVLTAPRRKCQPEYQNETGVHIVHSVLVPQRVQIWQSTFGHVISVHL